MTQKIIEVGYDEIQSKYDVDTLKAHEDKNLDKNSANNKQ